MGATGEPRLFSIHTPYKAPLPSGVHDPPNEMEMTLISAHDANTRKYEQSLLCSGCNVHHKAFWCKRFNHTIVEPLAVHHVRAQMLRLAAVAIARADIAMRDMNAVNAQLENDGKVTVGELSTLGLGR
jgi:hypothetical protein